MSGSLKKRPAPYPPPSTGESTLVTSSPYYIPSLSYTTHSRTPSDPMIGPVNLGSAASTLAGGGGGGGSSKATVSSGTSVAPPHHRTSTFKSFGQGGESAATTVTTSTSGHRRTPSSDSSNSAVFHPQPISTSPSQINTPTVTCSHPQRLSLSNVTTSTVTTDSQGELFT